MNYYTHARKLWRNYWRELRAETMRNAYGTTRHDTRLNSLAFADIEPDTDESTQADTAPVWELPTRRDTLTLAEWRSMRGESDTNYATPDDY
jgi:hypothetical protein